VLGPGESETITFKLDAAGEYNFICSFPGHYALMKGVITAK
jgi:azurin